MVTGKTMHPLPQNVEKTLPHVWSVCRKGAARQVCTTKHLAPTDPLLFQGGVDVCCPTCLVAYHALPGSVSWSTSLNLKYHSCHNLRPCICQQRRCNILSWPLQLVVENLRRLGGRWVQGISRWRSGFLKQPCGELIDWWRTLTVFSIFFLPYPWKWKIGSPEYDWLVSKSAGSASIVHYHDITIIVGEGPRDDIPNLTDLLKCHCCDGEHPKNTASIGFSCFLLNIHVCIWWSLCFHHHQNNGWPNFDD